jgi:colicin import membrane protein
VRLSRLLISALLALSVPLVAQADSSPEAAYQQELKEAFYAVRDRVGQQWDVPPGAKPMKEASLTIEVHPNGNFKAAMVTSSSGDRQFDRSAIKAIAKALPIPEWRSLSTRTRERLSRFKLNLGPRGEEKAQSNQETTS